MPTRSTVLTGRLPSPLDAESLVDTALLEKTNGDQGELLDRLKQILASADEMLAKQFWEQRPVEDLVSNRAWVIEQMLILTWRSLVAEPESMALVAVGGFGRGELHPHSDVDLMILLEEHSPAKETRNSIEAFLTLLWDAGLYLGHSVRTLEDCRKESLADVVTTTTLMESRLLDGNRSLFDAMRASNGPDCIWPGPEFFEAKYREQLERHQRFHDTAYNLEPNIKEGPGGLRDIQMISWVTKRHLGADSLHGLVEHGFLNESEFEKLHAGQLFLWKVRFALHLLAGRAEDRLLFDFQRQIAEGLEYGTDSDSNLAVEKFMQQYYRIVMQLERLNESLLQHFREELLTIGERPDEDLADDPERNFVVQKGFLDVRDENLFIERPEAMIRMFVLLAGHPDFLGVRASTIRMIRDRVSSLDADFGKDPKVLAAFYELLCQPSGVYTQLQRMNRYGVLAALLPAFAQITGRMQFDLFHVYTVDQHILFVVRNLRRFAYGKYAEMFPRLAEIFERIDKPELLYLAALFHDIAKGRNGDHSELGALDAREFCELLQLPAEECALVAWLVQQHLLMSQTAQRRDISDPEVIAEFASKMESQQRLEHLYLLTVADIAATSPALWNSWKSGLLTELYQGATHALSSDTQPARGEYLESNRQGVLQALLDDGEARAEIIRVWKWLPSNVFQRFSPGQMRWSTKRLLAMKDIDGVVISSRARSDLGITEVLVSAPDYTGLFASTTAVFDEMGLDVLSARVLTTRNQRSFDLFQVMNAQGAPLSDDDSEQLDRRLCDVLGRKTVSRPVKRKMPRRLRPFVSKPTIRFGVARSGTVTSMDLECTDRPGLLSQLASALVTCNVRIHDARIATFGDRVEDNFLLTDEFNRPLTEEMRANLVIEIGQRLKLEDE